MAKNDKFYPKGYFDENPGKYPESLEQLKGHEFHSVARIRLGGNENRTLLALFRPKQLAAFFEYLEGEIGKAKKVATAKLRVATNQIRVKDAALKVVRRDLSAARTNLDEVEEALSEAIAKRDKALAQMERLSKKSLQPSADAQELKEVKRELERVKSLFDTQREAKERLEFRFSALQCDYDRDSSALSITQNNNAQLMNNLRVAYDILEAKGISIPGVEQTSGMVSGSTVLGDSSVIMRSNKPLPNGNPGTRR